MSFEQGENVWEARHRTEHTENRSSSKAAEKETSRKRAGRKTLDSCAVLGASPEDDLTTIRTQYRRVALSHHPDKGGSKQAFVRLQGAKDYMLARNAVEHSEEEVLKKHTSSFRHAASMQFAAGSSDSEEQDRSEGMLELTGRPVRSSVDLTRLEKQLPMPSMDELQAAKPPRHLSIPEEDPSDESDCQKVMARTMSTECPPSRRQTRSSIDSQDLNFAMDDERFDTWAPQVASSEGDMVLSQTPRRGSVVSADGSLEAMRSAGSQLGEVALTRKALEQDVRTLLREMDHHCEAITETYRQLASLNGKIGDAFLDLRYAWAPLHCEKVDGVA